MRMTITTNSDEAQRRTAMRARQLPFAASLALNRVAAKAKLGEEREIRDVFDRPTAYTLKSVYVNRATKTRLEAVVALKDFASNAIAPATYLLPQIRGGQRPLKRFEKALQSVGALPDDYRTVPGSGAKLDAYGNMSRGQIVQLLSYFKAFPEAGYSANITNKRRKSLAKGSKRKLGYTYFVGRPGDRLPLGIWQRFNLAGGTAIKPILIFVRSAMYDKAFDFAYVGELAARGLAEELRKAMDEAMATAR